MERSAVLNDTPTCFVKVVTVSAIKKKDSTQRHIYVKANMVQYTASQTWRVKQSWLHKTTGQEKIARWHTGVKATFHSQPGIYLAA